MPIRADPAHRPEEASKMDLIRQIELENMKPSIPDFGVGDGVDVHSCPAALSPQRSYISIDMLYFVYISYIYI
jgi:hypothetical protein